MNVGQMLLDVRLQLGDINLDSLKEPELYFALNRAKDLVYDLLIEKQPDRWIATSLFSTVDAQQEYDLPASMKRLDRIQATLATGATATIYEPIQAYDAVNTFYGPVCWVSGAKFYLSPTPAYSGSNNGTIVYIAEKADAVSAATDWAFPSGINAAIILRAAMMIRAEKGDTSYQALMPFYQEQLQVALKAAKRSRYSGGLKLSPSCLRLDDD